MMRRPVQALFQRALIVASILLATLFLYYIVVGPSSGRYSIYKLARAEPVPADQLLPPGDDQSTFAGPRVERGDIPHLIRLNQELERVIDHVQPAVVSIDTTSHERKPAVKYFEETLVEMPDGTKQTVKRRIEQPELMDFDLRWETPGVGSGVFISEDGVLITSHHVVLDVDNISVSTYDGEVFAADLIS